LAWYKSDIISALYSNGDEFRLRIISNNKKLITAIVCEYGEILEEHELDFTQEHYNTLVKENAIEQMNAVL
jgi:hypothetical protein